MYPPPPPAHLQIADTHHLPSQLLRVEPIVVKNAKTMIAMKPGGPILPVPVDAREQQKRATEELVKAVMADEGAARDNRIAKLGEEQERARAAHDNLVKRVDAIGTRAEGFADGIRDLKGDQQRERKRQKRDHDTLSARLSALERHIEKQPSAPPSDDSFLTSEVSHHSCVVILICF